MYTHNFWNPRQHVPTVRSGHDPRALFCVARKRAIWVDTVNSNSINTVDVAAIRTTITSYPAITSSKGVDGTQAFTTLEWGRPWQIKLDLLTDQPWARKCKSLGCSPGLKVISSKKLLCIIQTMNFRVLSTKSRSPQQFTLGVLSIMPEIPEISVGIEMEKSVSVSSDRNIRDHLWRWSTYFGWNIPTEICRSIFDKPVLCPN